MPVQTDAPTGLGATDDWGLWGGGATDKIQAVSTNDGDTSVIYAASGGRLVRQLFTFPALSGVTDPVTSASLTAIVREYYQGGGGRSLMFVWNSAQVGTNQESTVHSARPNYVTLSYSAAAGGLALAALNGEHGLDFSAAGGPSNMAEFWCTQMYRTVNYEYLSASAGDFAYLIGSLVGSLIGAGLLLRDMPALAARMGRIRLRPDEYPAAWREWNAYRHPVYGV